MLLFYSSGFHIYQLLEDNGICGNIKQKDGEYFAGNGMAEVNSIRKMETDNGK